MFVWPKQHDNQPRIIKQFRFLQDQLTIESAIELRNKAPGCGFLYELHQARHLHYEDAFQSYLTFL